MAAPARTGLDCRRSHFEPDRPVARRVEAQSARISIVTVEVAHERAGMGIFARGNRIGRKSRTETHRNASNEPMALKQLSEEQVRSWTRTQKDEWWFKNVFRGDMPQLTIRSGITGFLLGGVLAATALYIAAKTGITIGVGLTSVILAFAIYRIMNGMGMAQDFTILENNCTQSIATAAGYMVAPMISSLSAYMLVTGQIIPPLHMIAWMVVVSILGVLLAF